MPGSAVTVVALFCATVPPAEITNFWLFEGKLAAGTLAIVVSAHLLYRRGAKQLTLPLAIAALDIESPLRRPFSNRRNGSGPRRLTWVNCRYF